MANETTTTSAASTLYAKIVAADILNELRPYNVLRPFFRQGPAGSSKLYSFTTQTAVAITEIRSVTEGADQGTISQISTSNQDATAAQKGILAFITDLLIVTSVLDAMGQFSAVLARTLAQQFETDLAAQGTSNGAFTNTTGDANTTMTMLRLIAAQSALSQVDVAGTLVCIQHPKNVGDLQQDVGGSLATFLAGNSTAAAQLGGVLASTLAGYVGEPFGIPLYQTSVVPAATGGNLGTVFRPNEALGLYELWNFRVEVQRDASKLGNEIVCSGAYGLATIAAARGQIVKSKS